MTGDIVPGASPDEPLPMRLFTVHLDFVAASEPEALVQAVTYAEGMNTLRPEVDCFTARMSADGNWSRSAAVYCGAAGPDEGDVCLDSAGHAGWHHGPGVTDHWDDDEVPAVPDTIEDLGSSRASDEGEGFTA